MARIRTTVRSGPDCGLTAEIAEAAYLLVKAGMRPKRALMSLGVSALSIWRYAQRAEEGIEPYAERMGRIALGEAIFLGSVELHIGKEATEGDWRCSDKVLSKRLPTEYGERIAVEAADANPEGRTETLTDDELRQQLEMRGLPLSVLSR